VGTGRRLAGSFMPNGTWQVRVCRNMRLLRMCSFLQVVTFVFVVRVATSGMHEVYCFFIYPFKAHGLLYLPPVLTLQN
jgi:hypothetical protein